MATGILVELRKKVSNSFGNDNTLIFVKSHWNNIVGIPSDVINISTLLGNKAPLAHNHDASDITSGTISNSRLPSTFVNLTDGVSNLPYKGSIVIYGDSDKYYPVHFAKGDQNLLRTIKIWRTYLEQAPNDWNTSTHKGSLNLEWKGNYGGWGGASYHQWIYENSSQYTTLLAETQLVDNSYAMAFFLRGGGTTGALYHFASDQPLTWTDSYLTYTEPTAFYNQEKTFANSNSSYERYAPAPRTTVNTSQLDSITVVKGGDSRLTNARPASDVHSWAKAENRPSYDLSDIADTTTYKKVTQTEKDTWNAKQSAITGAATTITSNDLTTNRVLISNASGKVTVAAVTSTELNYLDGVTSNIQTQLNAKAASSHSHTIANVTGLQSALNAKAASSHSHTIANVTGLQSALDGKTVTTLNSGAVNSVAYSVSGSTLTITIS